MEELHSTEVLDREILEDARKKAFKILKAADDTTASQARRWEKKSNKAIEQIRKTYAEQTEKVRGEITARFPLDKRRLRSETAEFFLRDAMDKLLLSLERERMLLILQQELEQRLSGAWDFSLMDTEKGKLRCVFSSMTDDEVIGLLEKAFANPGKPKDFHFDKASITLDRNAESPFPMLILDTPLVKITASVENIARELLKDKRAELASALLGKEALND